MNVYISRTNTHVVLLIIFAFMQVWAFADEPPRQAVTLLLPGMKLDLQDPTLSFGSPTKAANGKYTWTGIIGSLERSGKKFGGVIRPKGADLSLPRCLDRTAVTIDSRQADVFVLDYSSSANVDGLAYKTLELAECLKKLKRYARCQEIHIVAYSAGGLVARTYLQNALPGIEYGGEVGRLVTVCTPHLGCTKAEHFGDFLGTRATALKPASELVQRLNDTLELPAEVDFASIIVRGSRIGSRRLHDNQPKLFKEFVDRKLLIKLPLDFQKGSDQVVNVWSQNLALTNTARRYEAANKRPVQFALARVEDPSPGDWLPFDTCVHEVAPNNIDVVDLVKTLLKDEDEYWTGLGNKSLVKQVHREAKNCAYGIIEDAMARNHKYSEVFETEVKSIRYESNKGSMHKFKFEGTARSKWRAPPRIRSTAEFAGDMSLNIDKYGRVVGCRYTINDK